MRRFDKHNTTPSKPSNVQLHNENQSKLSELLRLREEQDKGAFPLTVPAAQSVTPSNVSIQVDVPITHADYTPWKTPASN